MTRTSDRLPAVAGSFYPDEPRRLRQDVEKLLAQAPAGSGPLPLALVVPHAGYVYSGAAAAAAYRRVSGQTFDLVIIVAPSHHHGFAGFSVYNAGSYLTPLGAVPVARELADSLIERFPELDFVPAAHRFEHSLEVQLPFLQVALGEFTLLPLIMGQQSFTAATRLAEIIVAAAAGRRVLLVASTDLSHFHEAGQARALDQRAVAAVAEMAPEKFWRLIAEGRAEACGAGPLLAVMLAAGELGAGRAEIIRYCHSGEVSGDHQRVVGYLAAAFYREPPAKKEEDMERNEQLVDESCRSYLKALARYCIGRELGLDLSVPVAPVAAILGEKCGAFVTLKKRGRLRGCIGYIEAYKPLRQTIEEMALAAAFRDPRFPPVKAGEFADLSLEISVLSPLREISDPAEVEPGQHGIYLSHGGAAGLLLPQVAVEYGWGREEFLAQTCVKAGLASNCWRQAETRIQVFTAEVF